MYHVDSYFVLSLALAVRAVRGAVPPAGRWHPRTISQDQSQKRNPMQSISSSSVSPVPSALRAASSPTTMSRSICHLAPVRNLRDPASPSSMPANGVITPRLCASPIP